MRDYLDGVQKVKRIMSGTTYICRHCGLAYSKFMQAERCCKHNKAKRRVTDGTGI
jgi:hypothetical protein